MKKIYYYLQLKQMSPLRIGTGSGEYTDNDLRVDGGGRPYIPGSSLAGVLRAGLNDSDANRLFGNIDVAKQIGIKENLAVPSRLIISSADMKPDVDKRKIIIGIRDGVGLNDWGMTIDKAKYDFQVVETDEPYYAVIEWTGNAQEEKEEIEEIFEPYLQEVIHRGLNIGARTSRGYGSMAVSICKKEFSFPTEIVSWLDYRPMTERFKHDGIMLKEIKRRNDSGTVITVAFAMQDSFNIRVNTARAEALEDGTVPDSVPLLNAKENPVIPGTAWAGVFRHHLHRLLRESGLRGELLNMEIKNLDSELFGIHRGENGDHARSSIFFSESEVIGGHSNTVMRNAVDRFTAAPKNTALFTTQVWTGGEGILRIQVDSGIWDKYKGLLYSVLFDMGVGLLAVGGEAGIGRGIMKIKKIEINGEDWSEKIMPEDYLV